MLQNSCTPIKFTLIHGNFIVFFIYKYGVSYKLSKFRPFCTSTKIKFLYDIEDEEFYFLIPLWMQKYVKDEKRYRFINFICLLAVYKKN